MRQWISRIHRLFLYQYRPWSPVLEFLSIRCEISTWQFCIIQQLQRLVFRQDPFIPVAVLGQGFAIKGVFAQSPRDLLQVEHCSPDIGVCIHRILNIEELVVGWVDCLWISVVRHLLLFLTSARSAEVVVVVLDMVFDRDGLFEFVEGNACWDKGSVEVMSAV